MSDNSLYGLPVKVYRYSFNQDTSNCGLSHAFQDLYIYGTLIPKSFEIKEINYGKTLKIIHDIKHDQFIAVPKCFEKRTSVLMFGGNFIYTSDSRFPFEHPIKVFDRVELPDNQNLQLKETVYKKEESIIEKVEIIFKRKFHVRSIDHDDYFVVYFYDNDELLNNDPYFQNFMFDINFDKTKLDWGYTYLHCKDDLNPIPNNFEFIDSESRFETMVDSIRGLFSFITNQDYIKNN